MIDSPREQMKEINNQIEKNSPLQLTEQQIYYSNINKPNVNRIRSPILSKIENDFTIKQPL